MSKRRYIHLLQKSFDQMNRDTNFHHSFFFFTFANKSIRVLSQMEAAPSISISGQPIYIYIHTHVSSHKRQPISIGAWTLVHACACTCHLSLSLSLFTLLTKYGRSGGGSSLSVATRGKQSKRPSVESGQPVCPPAVERERDLHLFQVSLRSFSLFRFLSLSPSATSAPPICIHPSRFKQRRYQLHRGCPDPLLIVRRCSAVWMEPEEWNVSPTTSSFSLSLFECEWCRAGTRKNFRLRSKKECLSRCGRIFEMFDKDFLFIFSGLLLLRI